MLSGEVEKKPSRQPKFVSQYMYMCIALLKVESVVCNGETHMNSWRAINIQLFTFVEVDMLFCRSQKSNIDWGRAKHHIDHGQKSIFILYNFSAPDWLKFKL